MSNEVALRREFAAITIPDLQKEIDAIKGDLADARDIDVCSAAMAEEAQQLGGRILTLHDKLDAQRLEKTKPLREGAAWVNDGFAPTLATLKGVSDDIKEKLRGWNKIVAERKREADLAAAKKQREAAALVEAEAKKQREEAERLQAEAAAAAAKGDAAAAQDLFEAAGAAMDGARDTAAVAHAVATAPIQTMRGGGSGVKGARKVWKCRVIDKAKALLVAANRPEMRGLFDANETFLNALAKTNQNTIEIPGLEFYEEDVIATRRA